MKFRITRFSWSVLLLLFSSALVVFSWTLPDIGTGPLVVEILVLWVLVILTIKTYLQETAPKANLENLSKAGWVQSPVEDPEDPYLVFARGRESLVVHAEDWDFVNYRLEDGTYWSNEDIRGDVESRILSAPQGVDTHTHRGATPLRARIAGFLSPIKKAEVKKGDLDTHSHTHRGATPPGTPPREETEAERKKREWYSR